jgi:hypothetical protein
MDFHVYWKAAQTWAGQGLSPYLYDASDRGFVFKYPPWMLPFFLPFGFLSLEISKVVWALIELGCIYYSVFKLVRLGLRPRAAILTAFLFWWIWLGHAFAGQFTVVLMASALWAAPEKSPRENSSSGKLALLGVILTAKVFSLVSLIGRAREVFRLQPIAAGITLLLFLHGIVYGVFALHGNWVSPAELYHQWVQSASSGGQELGELVVRGQMNHGFTAGVLRAFHVDVRATSIDNRVALLLAGIFSVIWAWASKRLQPLEAWVGWLGVGLIVHPLAWHHSFVMAYPLCAVSLDRAISSHDRRLLALSLLGSCCIGIFIPNVIGMTLATPLEMVSVKSWGVCFSALALVLARKLGQKKPA